MYHPIHNYLIINTKNLKSNSSLASLEKCLSKATGHFLRKQFLPALNFWTSAITEANQYYNEFDTNAYHQLIGDLYFNCAICLQQLKRVMFSQEKITAALNAYQHVDPLPFGKISRAQQLLENISSSIQMSPQDNMTITQDIIMLCETFYSNLNQLLLYSLDTFNTAVNEQYPDSVYQLRTSSFFSQENDDTAIKGILTIRNTDIPSFYTYFSSKLLKKVADDVFNFDQPIKDLQFNLMDILNRLDEFLTLHLFCAYHINFYHTVDAILDFTNLLMKLNDNKNDNKNVSYENMAITFNIAEKDLLYQPK